VKNAARGFGFVSQNTVALGGVHVEPGAELGDRRGWEGRGIQSNRGCRRRRQQSQEHEQGAPSGSGPMLGRAADH
jgi:hypothetical protein